MANQIFLADKATQDAIKTNTDLIGTKSPTTGGTDTLFKFLKQINDYVDTVEALLGTTGAAAGTGSVFARLAQIAGGTDSLKVEVGASTDVANPNGSVHGKLASLQKASTPTRSFAHPWLPAFGDGADGNFNPTSNTTLIKSRVYRFNNVTIPAGVTVTVPDGALILVKGTIIVNGLLTATGIAANGGTGATANQSKAAGSAGFPSSGFQAYGGAGGGGAAAYLDSTYFADGGDGGTAVGGPTGTAMGTKGTASSSNITSYAGAGPSSWFARSAPSDPTATLSYRGASGGGGAAVQVVLGGDITYGGNGGAAGGFIFLEAREIIVNTGGAIRADGTDGGDARSTQTRSAAGGGGGGGGGVIFLFSKKITNSGVISARGGLGGRSRLGQSFLPAEYNGGAGGDGYIVWNIIE